MTSLLKFGSHEGRERSLLAFYILHSLCRDPKSGYDLLAEIREKTGGLWAPSKGTLYPVLHQLEDEALVEIVAAETATGRRAKTTYAATECGRKTLEAMKARGREGHKKMACWKNLLVDIFGADNRNAHGLLFDIHAALERIPAERADAAGQLLEQCLAALNQLHDAPPGENGEISERSGQDPANKNVKTMKNKTMTKKSKGLHP